MTDRLRGPLKAVNAINKNNIDSSALPARLNLKIKAFVLKTTAIKGHKVMKLTIKDKMTIKSSLTYVLDMFEDISVEN